MYHLGDIFFVFKLLIDGMFVYFLERHETAVKSMELAG